MVVKWVGGREREAEREDGRKGQSSPHNAVSSSSLSRHQVLLTPIPHTNPPSSLHFGSRVASFLPMSSQHSPAPPAPRSILTILSVQTSKPHSPSSRSFPYINTPTIHTTRIILPRSQCKRCRAKIRRRSPPPPWMEGVGKSNCRGQNFPPRGFLARNKDHTLWETPLQTVINVARCCMCVGRLNSQLRVDL